MVGRLWPKPDREDRAGVGFPWRKREGRAILGLYPRYRRPRNESEKPYTVQPNPFAGIILCLLAYQLTGTAEAQARGYSNSTFSIARAMGLRLAYSQLLIRTTAVPRSGNRRIRVRVASWEPLWEIRRCPCALPTEKPSP